MYLQSNAHKSIQRHLIENIQEVSRLQGELRQYEEEFRTLKNQDIKIRQLEEQLGRFQEDIEDRVRTQVQDGVQAKVDEAQQKVDDAVQLAEERVRAAERRVLEATEAAKGSQQALERARTQLMQTATAADRQQADAAVEIAMLAESNTRVHARISELEGALASCAPLSSGPTEHMQSSLRSREDRLLRDQLSELQVQLQLRDEALRAERLRSDAAADKLRADVLTWQESGLALRSELAGRPTVAELQEAKHQLRQLQRLVYRVEDEADMEDSSVSPLTNTTLDNVYVRTVCPLICVLLYRSVVGGRFSGVDPGPPDPLLRGANLNECIPVY
jgi:homeobox protein cut-like